MVIYVDKQLRRRPAGRAVDFCPICRSLCVHDLVDVTEQSRVCLIPVTYATVMGREMVCHVCRMTRGLSADSHLQVVPEGVSLDSLEELADSQAEERVAARAGPHEGRSPRANDSA